MASGEQVDRMVLEWIVLLCRIGNITQERPLLLGNIEFWLDWESADGEINSSFLRFSPPKSQWDIGLLNRSLAMRVQLCERLAVDVAKAGGIHANKHRPVAIGSEGRSDGS